MIDLESLLLKLSGLSLRTLQTSPYQRFKAIEPDEIEAAFETVVRLRERGFTSQTANTVKLLFLINYSQEVESMSANFACSDVSPLSDQEIAEQADRMWAENFEPSIEDLETLVKRFGMMARVSNADRYPDAEWLDVVKPIGSVGGSTMFLVGWEVPKSNEYPLVSVDRGGQLWATPLWELQGHSQDKIVITEEF